MKKRRHYAVDKLPSEVHDTVDKMIKDDCTYADITDYVKSTGATISKSAVQRYAANLAETLQALRLSNESFRAIMDEIEKNADVDYTEPLIRILCGQILEQVTGKPDPKEFASTVKNTVALTRAISYKRDLELKSKKIIEIGREKVLSMLFETLYDERPDLYNELKKFIQEKSKELM